MDKMVVIRYVRDGHCLTNIYRGSTAELIFTENEEGSRPSDFCDNIIAGYGYENEIVFIDWEEVLK